MFVDGLSEGLVVFAFGLDCFFEDLYFFFVHFNLVFAGYSLITFYLFAGLSLRTFGVVWLLCRLMMNEFRSAMIALKSNIIIRILKNEMTLNLILLI